MICPQLGVRSGLAPRANISKTGICMKLLLPSVSWASIYTHTSPYPKPVLLANRPVCSPIATCRASFDSECAVLPPSHSRSSHPISGRIITIYFMILDPPVVHCTIFVAGVLRSCAAKKPSSKVTGKLDAALRNYDSLIAWETGLSAYQKARRTLDPGGPLQPPVFEHLSIVGIVLECGEAFFYLARLVPYSVLGGLYFSGQVRTFCAKRLMQQKSLVEETAE